MNYIQSTEKFTTILDFIRFGFSMAQKRQIYFGHGTDNALDDIYFLIFESLNLPLTIDAAFLQSKLTEEEKQLLATRLYTRVENRVPSAYITQRAYFCDLPFFVDERVLIPRSPIAELIHNKFTPWIDENNVHNILDLCTGSGCIAIALAYAFPNALVDASDISADALKVAKINQKMHSDYVNVNFITSDCFKNIPQKKYDIIVSNPPYVDIKEKSSLPQEYLHEPDIALYAKNKGIAVVEDILRNANNYLNDNGILVIEVGNLELDVINTFHNIPFTWLEFENGGQGVFLLTKEQVKDIV